MSDADGAADGLFWSSSRSLLCWFVLLDELAAGEGADDDEDVLMGDINDGELGTDDMELCDETEIFDDM